MLLDNSLYSSYLKALFVVSWYIITCSLIRSAAQASYNGHITRDNQHFADATFYSSPASIAAW